MTGERETALSETKKGGHIMKLTLVGRQMDFPEDLKPIVEKKLKKFDKFFKDDAEAFVTVSRKHNKERLELTISSGGTLYRSEQERETFRDALDVTIDVIERQIRKNKTRLAKRLREGAFVEPSSPAVSGPVEEEGEFSLRVKRFACRPMTPDEAILQMNLLDHGFYLFRNAESGEINLVYKRSDSDYGLIVPD